jgi:hypothetical protein
LRQQSQVVEHKISSILESLQNNVEFEIQEKQFADYEVNDPFANELILSIQKSLNNYENMLIENHYENILQLLAEFICSKIEKCIFNKKFTFVSLNYSSVPLMIKLFSGEPYNSIRM